MVSVRRALLWTILLCIAAEYHVACVSVEQSSPAAWPDAGGREAWKWLHGLTEEEAAGYVAEIPKRIEPGPFQPTLESLRDYQCPEWFRDAKFGIWVCYAPQAVPAKDGWYGRNMYLKLLEYHTQTYGHPSKFGFKDFIPELTAARFNPDDLVARFKEAGAKYFIALAVHHENFDLWDSTYHRWNAVRMGPKKDIIGMWRQATLKQGLRWGVTTHLARSLSWFQPSHGKDAGGEYDGNNPEYWDFYHKPFAQNTASYPVDPPPSWRLEWFLRVRDLIDRYKPDLMYFDGSVPFLPDGRPGLDIIAHLYNSSIKWHGGQNQAVMNIKDRSLGIYDDRIATLDLERQQLLDIRESPWQNDTSIGPWFYTNGASYKPPAAVIHMLVDIVSKNGNLLLNVPMRADGTIDEEAKALLKEVGKWMKVNGEAIYGTRPWIVAGEKTAPRAGDNRWRSVLKVARTSDTHFKLAPEDVRFTAKGDEILYAIFAGWPQDGRIVLHGLTCGPDSKASVLHVELLGRPGKLESSLSAEGLVVRLPEDKPCEHAWVLKISGKNLRDFEVRGQPDRLGSQESNARRLAVIEADDQGTFILPAEAATIHGPTPRLEHKRGASAASLGFWNSYRDWVSWRIKAVEKGTYRVSVTASSAKGDIPINVQVNGRTLTGEIHRTGSWEKFIRHDLGKLEIDGTGVLELEFRPAGESTWKPVGLMEIRLVKLPGGRGS